MSRFRRGQRGQPPPRTYQRTVVLSKPLMYVRMDDPERELPSLNVTLNAADGVDWEALRAAFAAVSEAVAKMAPRILARHQAENFVSQAALRAREQNVKDAAENGPPAWWGVSMQEQMDAFPEPIEEEYPTHMRDLDGSWIEVSWSCDLYSRNLMAIGVKQ